MTAITKIKTAAASIAVAAVLAAGAATPAAAQSGAQAFDPFKNIDTRPTKPTTPTKRFNDPGTHEGEQFGRRTQPTNPFATKPRTNTQFQGDRNARLKSYLVGTWNGRLNNGQTVRVMFLRNGGFAIRMNGSDVAQVGRFTVSGGVIRLQLSAMCSLSTKKCQRYNQVRSMNIGFRPVNNRTLQVRDGTLYRA